MPDADNPNPAPEEALGNPWPDPFPDLWASAWGEDGHGLWQAFTYKGVTQVLRWIPPGSFWMGSPEGEPERLGNELLHGVAISEGFWLADTSCTQALWQAVMSEEPSRFKGAERPVEQVSWYDAQRFCATLNRLLPELALRLPSEAQWEYACRAGTTTPFYFGETLSSDQVNYLGNRYNGGPAGKPRGETVEVKSLPANAWGLYQMHGNVWEWCQDWFGEYPAHPIRDPEGPMSGNARVLRGGAWAFNGQYCRSAYRSSRTSDRRDYYFGFRLARGRTRVGGRGAEGA